MFAKINSDSRSMMESVDEIIWSISPMNESLQGIVLRLREYAKPLAESKNIKFEFKTDTQIEKLNLDVEVRRNLYLIVKEAIN
jgi:signal transduction histidine kinase